MKIALIGPYPPPYGGISIHVQRLENLLKKDGHTPVVFAGGARRWLLNNWGDWFDFDVIHFHDISWKNRVLIGFLGLLGMPVALTIHGDSLKRQILEGNWFQKNLLAFAMRHMAHVIGVKDEIRQLLLSLGVDSTRLSVINAYLPPILEAPVLLPEEVSSFADDHSPLIVANGFGVIALSDRNDLYGIELTLDLCARLLEEFPRLGCLFYLAQTGDQERYERLLKKRGSLGLSENFLFVLEKEFAPILTKSTLFVRPTFEDGFGVSVSEALYFRIPAIASDVCDREDGSIIFRCGDIDDLYQQTRRVLKDHGSVKQSLKECEPVSAYDRLLEVYAVIADAE